MGMLHAPTPDQLPVIREHFVSLGKANADDV